MDNTANNKKSFKLDYSLKTSKERSEYIEKILAEGAPTSQRWLEIYSDYILDTQSKEEKQKKEILTDNRMVTINRHETSYEGLATKFENGEDGLSTILKPSDKNILFSPKDPITEKDVEEVPGLKELRNEIKKLTETFKIATGRKKYLIKKQIIELCQDQYILREAYRRPIRANKLTTSFHSLEINEDIQVIDNIDVISNGTISFFNKDHVSALLRTLQHLRIQSQGQFNTDLYYLVQEFDKLIDDVLKEKHPDLYLIVQLKTDGAQNIEIKDKLEKQYDVSFTLEYISSLWRNKIPKLLAESAKDKYLEWYYTFKEKGKWKKCSCCGEIKLASTRFFSKNKSSRDGLYSICKECRSNKYQKRVDKDG